MYVLFNETKIVKRLHLGFISQHENSTNIKHASFLRLDFHHLYLLEKRLSISNEVSRSSQNSILDTLKFHEIFSISTMKFWPKTSD